MEQVGAQVDMTRLVQMRDQLAADAAQAQWKRRGSSRGAGEPAKPQTAAEDPVRRHGIETDEKTKSGSYTTNAAALQTLRDRSYDNDRACPVP